MRAVLRLLAAPAGLHVGRELRERPALVGQRRDRRHRDAERLDLAWKVALEPLGDALGQRRDDHLVVALELERLLDRLERVRAADEAVDLRREILLRTARGPAQRLQAL